MNEREMLFGIVPQSDANWKINEFDLNVDISSDLEAIERAKLPTPMFNAMLAGMKMEGDFARMVAKQEADKREREEADQLAFDVMQFREEQTFRARRAERMAQMKRRPP